MEILDPLLEGPLTALPLDASVALTAAKIRAKHYHRANRPISLADAVLIASAKPDRRIATADPDVLAVAKTEGIEIVALPGQG
jgi:predicted nucleic acid-binding protein